MEKRTGALILLAAVLVIAYLVARPHLGHTWYLCSFDVRTKSDPQRLRPGFLTEKDCVESAERMNAPPPGVIKNILVRCQPELELLWGW